MRSTIKPAPKTVLKPLQDLVMSGIDTVLPPRCVITGEMVDKQGMIAPEAWAQLEFIADPKCAQCGFPFEFEVEKGSLCASCIDRPPPFKTVRSALKYNDASRDLVLGFKHADKLHSVLAFIPWLEKAGADMLEDADFLVPVPLHRWRLLGRRYNQSAIIGQELSKSTKIPMIVDAIKRIRATPSQGYLKAAERHKNVKHAFAMNSKRQEIMKGKTVVIIDDVFTTGATVKECTKTLLKAGVKEVHILTLTRTIREGFGG